MTDHYELLGVAPTPPRRRSARPTRASPARGTPTASPTPRRSSGPQTAFQDITTAFNALVNPRSRAGVRRVAPQARRRGRPRRSRRDAFERAQPLLEGGRLDEAVTLLRTAVHHAPDQAAYHAALGRALARVPALAREAVQALERATQLAPQSAAAFADLAAVLARQGLRLRAQKAMETALRLAPRDAAARPPRRRAGPGPAVSAMKIRCEARSDVGRKRKGNEDSLFLNPEQKLYVVADGMGGHAAGEVASRVAVDAINEFVTLTGGNEEITWPFGLDDSISYEGNRLKTAIRHANRRVLEATRESPEYEGMATTVAAVLVDGDTAHLAHVGDSRIYLWSGGRDLAAHERPLVGQRADPERRHLPRAGAQPPPAQRRHPRPRRALRPRRRHPVAPDGPGRRPPPLLGRAHHHDRGRGHRRASSRRRRATSPAPRRRSWTRPTSAAARTTSRWSC